MFDTHDKIGGIFPLVFGISTYSLLMAAAILSALALYLWDMKHQKQTRKSGIVIVAAALVFGIIGSKLPLLFGGYDMAHILTGKSIVGALIGGMLGVILIKKAFHIKEKMGNSIAPAAALGMCIGRLGCFFGGCCYGKIATWGMDFGDGFLRLPTQLFEATFHFLALIVLLYYKNKVKPKGILFKLYIIAYFTFRFIIEFWRDNPTLWQGLTIYQILCILGVLYIGSCLMKRRKNNESIA